jgi:hypothetical protein
MAGVPTPKPIAMTTTDNNQITFYWSRGEREPFALFDDMQISRAGEIQLHPDSQTIEVYGRINRKYETEGTQTTGQGEKTTRGYFRVKGMIIYFTHNNTKA